MASTGSGSISSMASANNYPIIPIVPIVKVSMPANGPNPTAITNTRIITSFGMTRSMDIKPRKTNLKTGPKISGEIHPSICTKAFSLVFILGRRSD